MGNFDAHKIFDLYVKNLIVESSEQPSGDPTPSNSVTLEQRTRLERLKRELGKRIPLFGPFISQVPVIFDDKIGTMAVDNYDNLYISPKFFDELSDNGAIIVLAHEMSHIFHEHPADGVKRGLHPRIHNFATDYVINRDLQKEGFDISKIRKTGDPFPAVTPLNIDGKYYISVKTKNKNGDTVDITLDVTDATAYEIYYKLIEQAMVELIDIDKLANEIEKKHGKPGDEHIGGKQEKPQQSNIYKPGDMVQDISSKLVGKVIKASPPDSKGEQVLDIDWNVTVNETVKYLTEAIKKNVSSRTVVPYKPQPPQQPQQPQQSGEEEEKQPQQPGEEQEKQQQGKKGGKDSGKGSGEQQGGTPESKPGGEATKPSEGVMGPVKKRTGKIPFKEKQAAKKEDELTKEKTKRTESRGKGAPFDVTGERHIDWIGELRDVLVRAKEYRSTIMPDWRSEAMGRYIRGRKEIKQKVTVTVMVDTSGSVSKKMYTTFMNEVISILDSVSADSELNLILWHSKVYSTPDLFHIDSSDTQKILNAPFESGGTNFKAPIEFYKTHKDELEDTNILIIFTDGDFNGYDDENPDILNDIPSDVKIVFALFKPYTRHIIDKYTHPNITVIETDIRK